MIEEWYYQGELGIKKTWWSERRAFEISGKWAFSFLFLWAKLNSTLSISMHNPSFLHGPCYSGIQEA